MLAEKGTMKALLCPVLSGKASAKGTHKTCIEPGVVGAQVIKVRDPPHCPQNKEQAHGGSITDCSYQSLQLDGRITSCSKKEQVFPSRGQAAVKSEIFPMVHRIFGHT